MSDQNEMKEYSRHNFTGNGTVEHIQIGAVLRIADATEKMALRYTELIDKAARLDRSNDYLRTENHRQRLSISALKGQITKLKKKAAQP